MMIVGLRSINTIAHFSHLPNSDFCPTKAPYGKRYMDLLPNEPNKEKEMEMKSYFISNWQVYFSQLDFFVKGLSKKEFFEVIQLADKARIWEYSCIELFHLPYILATLMDFPPEKSRNGKNKEKIRKCYFRCFF